MTHPHREPEGVLDAAAAALSSLCLLHCLLLPLGLGLAPALLGLSSLHGPVWLHWALLLLAAPVSILALKRGHDLHGDSSPWKLAALGFGLMAAGALAHESGPAEQALTVLGGLVVALAHWRNWKARHPA